MTHWRRCLDADWLMCGHLDGAERTWTIKSVARQKVKFAASNETKTKPVISFAEIPLPYAPGATVCAQIEAATGSADIEGWVGKRITLYPTITRVKGVETPCIRVRPTTRMESPNKTKSAT